MTFSPETEKAIEASLLAGKILQKGFGTQFSISSKKGKHNLVTEYDHASEKELVSFFRKHFPNDSILSEECGNLVVEKSHRKWIIDPLDGTVNFAHGVPFFSVSIALQEGKDTLCGVVYHPLLQELFVAEKSKGAFLNQKKIQVSLETSLDNSFLATGFPYNLSENPNHCIEHFTDILKKGIPVRRLGAATLDLAYVAMGRFDAFFEVLLAPWDCAAGNLLIEEAGGKVSSWDDSSFEVASYKPILASNGKIHKELSTLLSKSL